MGSDKCLPLAFPQRMGWFNFFFRFVFLRGSALPSVAPPQLTLYAKAVNCPITPGSSTKQMQAQPEVPARSFPAALWAISCHPPPGRGRAGGRAPPALEGSFTTQSMALHADSLSICKKENHKQIVIWGLISPGLGWRGGNPIGFGGLFHQSKGFAGFGLGL